MSQSIGQRLKQEREARYLTLEKASDATRIRIVFLQALESDDYSSMPSAAQGRGFLRNYAEYLDLNIDEMISDIQRDMPAEISGPLPTVNLAETDLPPLTNAQDEKPAFPFLSSLFGRRPKAESLPEAVATEPLQEQSPVPVLEVEAEQPRARSVRKKKAESEKETLSQPATIEETVEKKAEEQNLPVEAEQEEVKEEAKPGLISRLVSLFRSPSTKPEILSSEIEDETLVVEPEIKQALPSQRASLIFSEIGLQLRARRELISLTLDEVERHTKLRAVFVKALEDGDLDKLPSPVQTRGMLANYATFLDLDADTILLRFADYLQAQRYEKFAETPREKIQTQVVTSMPLLRSFIAGDVIFGVAMIVILAALAIWGVGRVVTSQAEDVEATAPSVIDILGDTTLPTATLDVAFVPVNDSSFATSTDTGSSIGSDAPTSLVTANVVVSIFAVERVFMRVSVDGKVAFEGRLAPRETKVFEADNQVVVLTGNAAALRVTYNGRDLGLMGTVGEVVNRVYLISGIVTPTATIAPTATNTPLTTFTPTPTVTPPVIVTPTAGG